MIVDGRLPAGARINEVRLADDLGVSRTPLREALGRLVSEGAVVTIPRRGFFVEELTADELRNLYPIRALLDPEALRLSGIPGRSDLSKLDALNDEIRSARSAERAIDLDDRWHLMLVAKCSNTILVDLIRQFMQRTRRYEQAYMKETRNIQRATREHEEVIRLLRGGKLDDACVALRRNMQSGTEPILAWLDERIGREGEQEHPRPNA